MAAASDVSSAVGFVAVTPNDSTTFAATRALYVGVAGDVVVDGAKRGTQVTMTAASCLASIRGRLRASIRRARPRPTSSPSTEIPGRRDNAGASGALFHEQEP
jgi:hypothetical protein